MKISKFIVFLLVICALFITTSSVNAKQNFEFYYQTVEKVEANTGLGKVAGVWNQITGNNCTKEGRRKWYSKADNNLVYTVNRVKINSRQDLIDAIGVPESAMNAEQKAILNTYDMAANSKAIDERSKYSYRDPITILFTDTSTTDWSYTDKKGNTNVVSEGIHKKDFWSWSNGDTISLSTESDKTSIGMQSTMMHEYCHSIDKTNSEKSKPYGPDGTHYLNEMTKPKVAFVEGWAEYNEMIEFPKCAADYKNCLNTICVEYKAKDAKKLNLDPAEEGKTWFKASVGDSIYVNKSAQDLTAEELWKCEAYNCTALYELATGLDDGKQKIYDAFIATRGKSGRDIRKFVKELCNQNPGDIAKIGQILDNLTYGKMTDKEFKEFLGKSAEAQAFLDSRATSGNTTSCPSTTSAGGISGAISEIGSTIGNIGSGIASRTVRIGTGIASTTRIIGSRIASTTRRIGTGIASVTRNIGSRIASATRRIGAGTASATQSIGNTIGDAIDSIGNAISNFIEKVKEVYNEVKEVVKNTVNKVVDFFKNPFKKQSDDEIIKDDKDTDIDENTGIDTTSNIDVIDNEEGNSETEVIEINNITTDEDTSSELNGTSDEEGNIFNIR